jgi:hypothetical protein
MNAIVLTIVAVVVAALGIVALRWWWRERQFIWRTEDITANILRDDAHLKIGQFLNLDQKLRPNEGGWTNMKIDIPEHWSVGDVAVRDGRVLLTLRDGSTFCLHRRNVGRLTFDILDGGNKSDPELQRIWKRYASVTAA